ncbi:MAG UNVERIFIED_CONTAM: hypothetical protein LVT10_16935 [Anaerolineae bacterium]
MNRVLKHVLLLVVVCWMSMAFAQDQGIPNQTNTTEPFSHRSRAVSGAYKRHLPLTPP